MSSLRVLRRYLRVLAIKEEQAEAALESTLVQMRELQSALEAATKRARGGREIFRLSADTGEVVDRAAALIEIENASHIALILRQKIFEAEEHVAAAREALLAKRVERRQCETMTAQTEARLAAEAAHRSQQSLDSWYLDNWASREEKVSNT